MNLLTGSALRRCVMTALAIALTSTVAAQAQQGAYPNRKITLVVGFAAGGFADTLARSVGQKLGERFGESVIVENRAGAAGNTAAKAVSTAAADGYTVLVTTTALAINETMYKKLDYALTDLAAVAIPASSPEYIAVHPSKPAPLPEFLKWAADREITMASAGVGSGSHLAAEYFFSKLAKLKVAHVPFRGGAPAIQATLGNQVDVIASSFGVTPHVAEGKLKGLAVASAERVAVLPQLPTYAESGFPGFEAASWVGFFVQAKTDPAIVAKLNEAINAVIAEPAMREHLSKLGYQLAQRSQPETARYLEAEVKKWGTMVQALGVYVTD
jgi:tripartite-type tricarboxylate transporter receptor subunit TctC